MRKFTFERILLTYLLLAALLAFLLPLHLAIERYAPIDPTFVPFAGWLRHTPGASPFLSTYFFVLTALLPVVVTLLARHPQRKNQFQYQAPTFWQCAGATLISLTMVGLTVVGMYGQIIIDGAEQNHGAILMYVAAISRFGLAFVGPLLMGTIALVLYISFVKVPRMWLGLRASTFG